MYDLYYVKKRRRRRIAALVSLIASIGVASLIVTSFLGRNTGTFTIKVVETDVKLSLSDNLEFKNSTTYIHLDRVYPLREHSYKQIVSQTELIDNEITNDVDKNEDAIAGYDEEGNVAALYYMKYTFYVKNSGNSAAQYDFSVNFTDRTKATDGSERTLDDTIRVMIYDTDVTGGEEHAEPVVYAKESAYTHYYVNEDGKKIPTNREFISFRPYDEETEDEDHTLAQSFKSGQKILSYSVPGKGSSYIFDSGSIRRYTIVIWLEGADKESLPDEGIPREASLRIGVNIDAFKV